MTKKIYRSARGKAVDIGALMLQNEHTRAVGNMKVNARGDRINANNEIIKSYFETGKNVSDEVIPTSARHVKEMEREKYMAEKMRNTEKAHRKAVKAQIKDGENPEPQKLAQPTEIPERTTIPSGGLAQAIARAKEIKQEKLKATKQQTESKPGVNRL